MSNKPAKASRQTNLFPFFSFLSETPIDNRIAVITSCSKTKLDHKALASEIYQGDLFKKSKLIASKLNADFYIMSAKHGLIKGDKVIKPYDTFIRTREDIKRLRTNLSSKLIEELIQYEKVIIIMGRKYREILHPFFQDNFYMITSSTGLGEFKALLSNLAKNSKKDILHAVEEFKWNRVDNRGR